jgi:hypothetical protein
VHSVTFNRVETGQQERATVGHQFRGAKVLAISGADPVVVILERGETFAVPSGSVVHTEASAGPRVTRTAKPEAEPAPVAQPVQPGAVKSVSYHSGPHGVRTLSVGSLVAGSRRVVGIGRGDPVVVSLLNARGEIESETLCGAGSVAAWKYA